MLISAGSAKKSIAGYPAHNILAFSSGFNFFFAASNQVGPGNTEQQATPVIWQYKFVN
jgi:hypothetical protein